MRTLFGWLVVFATVLSPFPGWACEPIFPIVQLLGGATLVGPALITQSLAWLAPTVALKCLTFLLLERRLAWRKAALFMLVANALSTIPGVLIAAFAGANSGIIFALPLVGIFGMLVAKRFNAIARPGLSPKLSGGMAVLGFTAFFVASVILFHLAEKGLDQRNYGTYWAIKLIFVTLVACTGIVMSALLEEYAIAKLTQISHPGLSFYTSVFRANYVTLGAVLFVAALHMLPRRSASPHFLASLLQSLSSLFGLT